VPFGSIVVVVLIWTCISVPLCLFGTVIGRNWNGTPDNPCRVKRIPSPIPEKKVHPRPSTWSCAEGLSLIRICSSASHLSPQGIVGRTHPFCIRSPFYSVPCDICCVQPPSPPVPAQFYLKPWVICLMGGLLPFGSIFIEMYFIFTSFWNYKVQ